MSKGPARLNKVNDTYPFNDKTSILLDKVEAWALSHATLILFIAMAFLIALFTVLMFAIVGVSATESGVQYNHLGDVI
jgi:hypothetical protein